MTTQRMLFLTMSLLMLQRIWLSGFDRVNGVLYLPMVFMAFAGLTGICPGLGFWKKMGFKQD